MFASAASGTAVSPTWNFLSTPLAGNGYYDFGWDATTSTLAVMDFQNRSVSIFAVPEPSTYATLAAFAGIGFLIRRRRSIG